MGTEPVTWKLDEHTKAKHELLRAFFNKWVSIHSEWFAAGSAGAGRCCATRSRFRPGKDATAPIYRHVAGSPPAATA